jgi:transcriptional regulator with PAS, ATPase and Fis domain
LSARNDVPLDLIVQSLGAMPDGLIVIDEAGKISYANRSAGLIVGFDPDKIVACPASDLVRFSGYDWTDVLDAVTSAMNGEFLMRGDRRGAVLATVRRVPDAGDARILLLRDLEVIDHGRKKAAGAQLAPEFGGGERRIRPDFAQQRRLSPYLDQVIARGERALLQGARVILTGESGVGKTEIARHLHSFIANPTDPFVVVNCAALPESLFESELFGYEKGAFTGALAGGRKGLIEEAEGGTLFLDEVGEIPLHLQAKLLSFLEDRVVQRVGGTKPKHVNVRVISATNRDLLKMAEDGRFRRDLYYRLAVVQLPVRPLRETPELISHLIGRFVSAINQRRSGPLKLSDMVRARLAEHDYPGNIRELYNLLQQISVMDEGREELLVEDTVGPLQFLADQTRSADPAPLSDDGTGLKELVARYEESVIRAAIRKHGSKRKAATALGVDIGTIVRKSRRTT